MVPYLRSLVNGHSRRQLLRLGLVGGITTAVDFSLANLFAFGLGWSPLLAVTWALIIATGLSYVLNRRWTFQLETYLGVTTGDVVPGGMVWVVL